MQINATMENRQATSYRLTEEVLRDLLNTTISVYRLMVVDPGYTPDVAQRETVDDMLTELSTWNFAKELDWDDDDEDDWEYEKP